MRGYHKRTTSSSVVRSLVALLLGGCDKAHRVLGLTDELHELAGGTLPVVRAMPGIGMGARTWHVQKAQAQILVLAATLQVFPTTPPVSRVTQGQTRVPTPTTQGTIRTTWCQEKLFYKTCTDTRPTHTRRAVAG